MAVFRGPPRPRRVPPKRVELLNALEMVEVSLSDLMRRWHDGITAELRAEIMDIYRPVLLILIATGRRSAPPGEVA